MSFDELYLDPSSYDWFWSWLQMRMEVVVKIIWGQINIKILICGWTKQSTNRLFCAHRNIFLVQNDSRPIYTGDCVGLNSITSHVIIFSDVLMDWVCDSSVSIEIKGFCDCQTIYKVIVSYNLKTHK